MGDYDRADQKPSHLNRTPTRDAFAFCVLSDKWATPLSGRPKRVAAHPRMKLARNRAGPRPDGQAAFGVTLDNHQALIGKVKIFFRQRSHPSQNPWPANVPPNVKPTFPSLAIGVELVRTPPARTLKSTNSAIMRPVACSRSVPRQTIALCRPPNDAHS